MLRALLTKAAIRNRRSVFGISILAVAALVASFSLFSVATGPVAAGADSTSGHGLTTLPRPSAVQAQTRPPTQQVAPAPPQNVRAANGPNPGEANVAWDAVSDASYYRIGWIAMADYEAIKASGGDWLEGFRFVDIANRGQSAHTVTRLRPGVRYAVIVASNDTRYGAPKWSQWAYVTLNADDSPCPAAEPTPITPAPAAEPKPATGHKGRCQVGMTLRPGDSCDVGRISGINIGGTTFTVRADGAGCVGTVCAGGLRLNNFHATRGANNVWTIHSMP